MDIVKDAVASLIRTDAALLGQKRALEILRDETAASLAGSAPPDAKQLQERVRKLAKEEGAKEVARLGDCHAAPAYKQFAQAAKLPAAGGGGDDDEMVELTQHGSAPGDVLCPLMKTLLVEPTAIKPCLQVGASKCIFTKRAITDIVRKGGHAGASCPIFGCAYKGAVKLSDLVPSQEMERKVRRALQEQERERLRRAAEDDEDAIDVDPADEAGGSVKKQLAEEEEEPAI